MKKIISLFIIILSFATFANDETQAYRKTQDIIGFLRVDHWIDYVKRIKTDDEIPNYYHFPTPSKEDIYYFKRFDIIGYENGLIKQIMKNMTSEQIALAHKKLQNPFISKVVSKLFFKRMKTVNFRRQIILAQSEKISKNKDPLIKSIFNLVGYESIAKHMRDSLIKQKEKEQKINEVLQKDNKNAPTQNQKNQQEVNAKQVKQVFLVRIDHALKDFSLAELRQFVQLIKPVPVQRILGIFKTYDYFFIYKYNLMLHKKEEQDIKRGLKPKKSMSVDA